MQSVLQLDNPWRRLPWIVPIAVLVWALLLWELGQILQRPPQKMNDSKPIEAEIVEIPPPPVVEKAVEPPPLVKPALKRMPVEKPAGPPRVRLQREAEPQPTTPGPAIPAPPEPPPQIAAPTRAPAPSAPSGDSQSAGTANMGARAIVRPLPQIPDDLREDAFNVVAVAKFQIAADGSATFELSKPTPTPRLNRLLLEKLKEWRFFPAMRDGKPVASTQEIRINLEVK